jgi:hypothetical protein
MDDAGCRLRAAFTGESHGGDQKALLIFRILTHDAPNVTAEIAILNKTAVALAADSAVTMQIEGGQKIYNTVNKLFTLSKYRPVGIMVYGNSEFMGVPWESSIKEHRRELGKAKHGALREYVDGFMAWIATAKLLFPDALQAQILTGTITGFFDQIKREIDQKVAASIAAKEAVGPERVQEIVTEVISLHRDRWVAIPRLATVKADYEAKFLERHADEIEKARASVFQELPLTADAVAALSETLPAIFCRDSFGSGTSGIVFAGFGEDEIFPSLIECSLETLVDGILKWKEVQTAWVDHFTNNATIVPFAQREMVDTFLSGVDPAYKNVVFGSLQQVLSTSADQVFNMIPEAALPNKKALVKTINDKIPEFVTEFNSRLNEYSRRRRISPIMNAVAALPKDELAAMAESLVNLTSFRRKISTEAETVGGQIDVAVISKGDGFIWIKRKHYFEIGKNPQFVANYYQKVE